MQCEEAAFLISARIDGDLTDDRVAPLDAHLAECEPCRQTRTEMETQDAALLRAFLPRQEAALALADRVSQAVSRDAKSPVSGGIAVSRWFNLAAGWTAAAAAGFLAAMVITRAAPPRLSGLPVAHLESPVAHLTLATGEVFACPSTGEPWRPLCPNESIGLQAAVRTEDSKCELSLPDGSRLRLNSATEARFTGSRSLSVSAGELCSAVPRGAAPLCISAGPTSVTAGGAGNQGAEFDVTCAADVATVTVQRGTADVSGNGPPAVVHVGQVVHAPSPQAAFVCTVASEPPVAPGWQDDLLLLKPGDDPEVIERVDQLLANISMDHGRNETPGEAEQHVRARGQAWCTPLACYLQRKPNGGESRRTAVRLLADLAPPSRIPDLIALLDDADGQVRSQAAVALRRLAGQTLGYALEHFAEARDPAAAAAWRQWWERNKGRYRTEKPAP